MPQRPKPVSQAATPCWLCNSCFGSLSSSNIVVTPAMLMLLFMLMLEQRTLIALRVRPHGSFQLPTTNRRYQRT
jgi:hypothetical protein